MAAMRRRFHLELQDVSVRHREREKSCAVVKPAEAKAMTHATATRRTGPLRVIFPRSARGWATVNVTLFSDVPGCRLARGKGANNGSRTDLAVTIPLHCNPPGRFRRAPRCLALDTTLRRAPSSAVSGFPHPRASERLFSSVTQPSSVAIQPEAPCAIYPASRRAITIGWTIGETAGLGLSASDLRSANSMSVMLSTPMLPKRPASRPAHGR